MFKKKPQKRSISNMRRFWIISTVFVLVAATAVFGILRNYLEKINQDSVSKINQVHMKESSSEIQHHFDTIINLRISQAQSLLSEAQNEDNYDTIMYNLSVGADAFGFTFIGMYQEDGNLLTIYQDKDETINIINEQPFRTSIKNDIDKVALGETQSGDLLFLQGVPADFSIGENNGIALVTGGPMDFLNEELSLQDNGDGCLSHIIRNDGSFIIKNDDNATENNYLDRVSKLAEASGMDSDKTLSDIKQKMADREKFSLYFSDGTLNHHCFYSPLTNSEWYLVTLMPEGATDSIIQSNSDLRLKAVMISGSIILCILLGSFILYYLSEKHQRSIVEKAKADAEAAKADADHANKAKSEFLSNMSHDIRTPINAILGLATLAQSRTDNENDMKNYLEKIILSGKHLLGLINDILDMSKIENGKLTLNITPTSLRETVNTAAEIIKPQANAKNQLFDLFIHDITEDMVFCDNVRLNQVLLNLLSNAVKFTKKNGTVRLTVWQETPEENSEYTRTHVIVQDNGIGMSEEFQKIIFDSFSRENKENIMRTEGTGLGMAITKNIIDAFGGTITVKSHIDQGSEFHITLDLKPCVPKREEHNLPDENNTLKEEKHGLQGKHILVAEDNELNWEIAYELLTDFGLKLYHAENGKRCLEMFEESELNYYSAILMDVRMPVMDGYETTRAIRSLLRPDADLPIIAMTADVFSEDIKRCLDSGMNDHIAKPIDIQQVMATLENTIIKKQ